MRFGSVALLFLAVILPLTDQVSATFKQQLDLRIAAVNSDNSEKRGLDAIAEIHRVLDDDQNGSVDSLESEDFIREDLSIDNSEEEDQRQLTLHRGDYSISVIDMQKNWLNSHVHNWTAEDVAMWLKDVVGLPQYLPIFKKNNIDGNFLPRLALNKDHIIQHQLGISDLNHKNKLILKAMDLVLFGPPTVFYNPLKDALLAVAILVAITGLFFSNLQRRKAKNQINKMLEEVEMLQLNEQRFLEIQSTLQEAEQKSETVLKEKKSLEKQLKLEINVAKGAAERLSKERDSTKTEVERLMLAEQELEQVRLALANAETKQFAHLSMARELQSYLKMTYRKEREQYNVKKAAADRQLEEAKQWGLKMKKKKSGMVNSLKMIHGNSLEAVENRIISARTALIEATSDLQELSSRWRKIENLCNFNITAGDAADTEFGSSLSLAGSDSPTSSEPIIPRANSLKTPRSRSLRAGSGGTPRAILGSTPNLASKLETPSPTEGNIVRNLSSNGLVLNGHTDSTDSDDSSRLDANGLVVPGSSGVVSGRKTKKGQKLWRLLRESRLNSDQKWRALLSTNPE